MTARKTSLAHAHAHAGASGTHGATASRSHAATSAKAHKAIAPSSDTAKGARHALKALTPDKVIAIIGTIASVMSVIMYVSYIPQIAANLSGNPGVFWQPLAAFFNCVFWTVYGIGTKPRQWPIIVANVPGIFLAAITVVTCFVH